MKILIHSRLNKQNIFWYDYIIATAIATHNPHSQPSTFTKGHLQHVVFGQCQIQEGKELGVKVIHDQSDKNWLS